MDDVGKKPVAWEESCVVKVDTLDTPEKHKQVLW